jgi:sugar phosphate isomerase/epimerase
MEELPLGVMMGVGENPTERLERIRAMGFATVQMGCPPPEFWAGEKLKMIKEAVAKSGVRVTTVFMGFRGESYADIPTVRRTVGFVPAETRAQRLDVGRGICDFAHELGVDTVAAHIGFVPEDTGDPNYQAVLSVVREIADYCKARSMRFSLETGQETGQVLSRFLRDVGRDNVKVNFDPANMILYGSGDPIEALELVGGYVVGVHCKDGNWPTEPGKLGHETPLGEGQVGIERFIRKLIEVGYRGPLTIEREITGEQQAADIMKAKNLLESLKAKLLPRA